MKLYKCFCITVNLKKFGICKILMYNLWLTRSTHYETWYQTNKYSFILLFTHPASFSPQPASQTKKCYNFVQAYSTLRTYHSSLLATRLVAQQLRLALEGVVAALARARPREPSLARARIPYACTRARKRLYLHSHTAHRWRSQHHQHHL